MLASTIRRHPPSSSLLTCSLHSNVLLFFPPLSYPPFLSRRQASVAWRGGAVRQSGSLLALSIPVGSAWRGGARSGAELARRGVACSAVSVDAGVFAVGRKETGEKEELKRFSPSSTSSSSLPRPFSLPLSLSPLSTPSLPSFLSVPLARTELSPARNRERRYPPRATAAPRGRLRASEG